MLAVDGLTVTLGFHDGLVPVVRDVSFALARGETLGVVGESGSGKTLLGLSLIGLLPRIARASGAIRLDGADLLALDEDALCRIRGRRIGMIFQEPMTALNPTETIGNQIAEGPRWHLGLGARAARARALDLLNRVGIPEPERRLDAYPHQLSGGQRQRVGIAMALACEPELLIADEPTTALDVMVQAQILALLRALIAELGMGLIIISHDLGVIAEIADRTLVMYAGRVVERGATADIFDAPAHPYPQGLFAALPHAQAEPGRRLTAIPGQVPDPRLPETGCRFAPRCPMALEPCRAGTIGERPAGPGHLARCIRVTAA